jgi:hypothetical protein
MQTLWVDIGPARDKPCKEQFVTTQKSSGKQLLTLGKVTTFPKAGGKKNGRPNMFSMSF